MTYTCIYIQHKCCLDCVDLQYLFLDTFFCGGLMCFTASQMEMVGVRSTDLGDQRHSKVKLKHYTNIFIILNSICILECVSTYKDETCNLSQEL